MKYERIKARELTPELTKRWSDVQLGDPEFASPYFRPEFTEVVATVRDDAFLGLIRQGQDVVGFFPFHRRRGGIGRPVGLGLCDYQAVIADSRVPWDVAGLMRGCGLVRYEFDHLLACQSQRMASAVTVHPSPIIGLEQGYEHYEATRDKAGRKQIREADRKLARLEEGVGPVTFVQHTDEADVLAKVMHWKSEQCRSTGTFDYFSLRWCRELVERIHQTQENTFGGMLSALYGGDELIAVHFGMRSRDVWHSWFPAYNHAYQSYSPGMILLLHLIRAAPAQGVRYIDLGRDLSLYKKRFMTGTLEVAEGRVERKAFRNSARHVRERVEAWARRSPLKPILKAPGRLIRQFERRQRYE